MIIHLEECDMHATPFPYECPISRAIKRITGQTIAVMSNKMYNPKSRKSIPIPKNVYTWALAWDQMENPKDRVLDIPELDQIIDLVSLSSTQFSGAYKSLERAALD